MPLQVLTAEEFVRRLHAYTQEESSIAQYALFVGAGCSITSGIPGANALVRERWIPRLHAISAPSERDALEWATQEFGIKDDRLPVGTYGRIMQRLLPIPEQRRAEVEALCSTAQPGFGYATLAQLVAQARGRFNVVLTTNFDDLVADALFLFPGVRPLVIHHGSLSQFIRAALTRPLIVKLHGHHQYAPLNTEKETQAIEEGLATGVRLLLHDRGLIFLGYSGNDEGIREVLSGLPPEALPHGVFWVSQREPTGPLRTWLEERDAFWVQHGDFDELMVHVRDVFGLPMPDAKRIDEMFDAVQQGYLSLSAQFRAKRGDSPEEIALKDAVERVDRTVRDWAVYELRAQRFKQSEPERAKKAYQDGLAALPDSIPLLGNFANFLKDVGDLDGAERLYLKALDLDPGYPATLHDYAIFLWRHRGNDEGAKEFISRAMDVEPGDPIRLSNYANFIWEVYNDPDGAEEIFRQAVSLPSSAPEPFRQYALFVQNERQDIRLADELYREALTRKPDDIVSMVNYASLATMSWDIETARHYLERAFAVAEDDLNVLGVFAIFLWQQRIDVDRAKELFSQAKLQKPLYAREVRYYAHMLIEYAWFMARDRNAADEGYALLSEARSLLPNDVPMVATTAAYMALVLGSVEAALELVDETIASEGESSALIRTSAILVQKFSRDLKEAEKLYRHALQLEPRDPTVEANLGGILLASGSFEEGYTLVWSALRRLGRADPALAVECCFYLFANGPADEREQALSVLKWLVSDEIRSPDWDLTPNVERAIADGHDSAEWLTRLAAVISNSEEGQVLRVL